MRLFSYNKTTNYSQTGQCAATHFLLPNAQKLFNKQTKKRKKKNYSMIYHISLKSVSIKIKRIQVFLDIKLHVLQTTSFFLTLPFNLLTLLTSGNILNFFFFFFRLLPTRGRHSATVISISLGLLHLLP